jgi:hypothetical protein
MATNRSTCRTNVNLLQYLPVEYNRDGKHHAMLRAMGARQAIEKNKATRQWEALGITTMQDGYVQVVKAIIGSAVGLHRLRDPFAGYQIVSGMRIHVGSNQPVRA